MRVETLYTDSSGTYRVRADIRENNRSIHILDIRDSEYNTEADIDDFTDEEKSAIHELLLQEYKTLDTDDDQEYDDEAIEEDEEDDY